MNIFLKTVIWGSVVGVIHFIVVGFLYQNPVVARIYKNESSHPGVKKWENKTRYIVSMFLGTQIEIYIITVVYIFLISLMGKTISNTVILGFIIAGVRIYPRFWNMWIQSSYPNRLLLVEIINGIIGTFVMVFSLYILPA